jgi:hypothetical protein
MGGLLYTTFFSTDGSIKQTQYWTELVGINTRPTANADGTLQIHRRGHCRNEDL